MELSFTKMQGCANDYIYLDCRTAGVPENIAALSDCLLYTSPSPRDKRQSRMPSSA